MASNPPTRVLLDREFSGRVSATVLDCPPMFSRRSRVYGSFCPVFEVLTQTIPDGSGQYWAQMKDVHAKDSAAGFRCSLAMHFFSKNVTTEPTVFITL